MIYTNIPKKLLSFAYSLYVVKEKKQLLHTTYYMDILYLALKREKKIINIILLYCFAFAYFSLSSKKDFVLLRFPGKKTLKVKYSKITFIHVSS